MPIFLFQSTQDILFVVTASSIAIITIFISISDFHMITLLKNLSRVAVNIEETTQNINSVLKPATIFGKVAKNFGQYLPILTNMFHHAEKKVKKVRSKKSSSKE